jgi:hypothetical protein
VRRPAWAPYTIRECVNVSRNPVTLLGGALLSDFQCRSKAISVFSSGFIIAELVEIIGNLRSKKEDEGFIFFSPDVNAEKPVDLL